jgi:RNA polymerase sigma-32 factor
MASNVQSMAPDASLTRYMQQIRKFPMLSHEEEERLARAWRDRGDSKAAHTLVNSHLRLVAKIAMGYRGYGLPVGELISEGNVGMMQAVKRFDPDRGFRLSTYAMWWIRAAIQEYILHSWSLVKMGTTAAQKKLFFNLRRLKGQMQAIDDGDLQPEQVARIAHLLDVPEQDVVNMNRRLSSPDNSLNAPIKMDGEGEWQDWLVDDSESQETEMADREELTGRKALLATALKTLSDRERHILIERRLKDNPTTLEELSPAIQHIPRTCPADRSARVREAAEVNEGAGRRTASGRAGGPGANGVKLFYSGKKPARFRAGFFVSTSLAVVQLAGGPRLMRRLRFGFGLAGGAARRLRLGVVGMGCDVGAVRRHQRHGLAILQEHR